jgi:hypothetical protein
MVSPNIISGQAIGTAITVKNSLELAQLSIQGLGIGTQVFNEFVAEFFQLTVSTAVLATDSVVEVDGVTGLRWIVLNPGAGGGSVFTDSTPTYYASPEGKDSNPGTIGKPKLTIYAAIETAVNTTGGGIVYIDDGTTVGGPVPGQGIRLRTDFLPGPSFFFPAEGFLSIGNSLHLIGVGKQNGIGPFTNPTVAAFSGAGAAAQNPPIWVVGSVPMNGLVIENLQCPIFETGVRIGVDYDRNLDGTVKQIAVPSVTRVGTQTTFTVTLPPGLTATSAHRVSNFTTLTVPNPGLPWPPWRCSNQAAGANTLGVPIRFAGSGAFPAGDYILSGNSSPLTGDANWTITYHDPGADSGPTVISAAVQTHGLCTGEIFELTSNDVNFFGTWYRVDSFPISPVDATKVTVTDPYSVLGNHTGTNIGTLTHQERFAGGTTNVRFRNVYASVDQNSGGGGPSWDIGHTQAFRPEIEGGWMNGYLGNGIDPSRDERRMAGMYIYPGTAGNQGPPSANAYIHDLCGSGGSIYFETGPTGTGYADVRRCLIEQPRPLLGLPAMRVDGNGITSVTAEDVDNADAGESPCVVLSSGILPSAANVHRCGQGDVLGACHGTQLFLQPGLWTETNPGAGHTSPWVRNQVTPWANNRITGKHPAGIRTMGVTQSRFKNVIFAPGSWNPLTGVALTATGILAPDGSLTAQQLVTSSSNFCQMHTGTDGNTWEVGGRFFVCGWVNLFNASHVIPDAFMNVTLSGAAFTGPAVVPLDYTGAGWQFFSGVLTVASIATSTPVVIIETLTPPGTVQLWGITAGYIPVAINDNDVYEFIGTVKHQPRYLLPGYAGTMEGQKLVAHGGLGTAARYTVGGAAGQITIGAAAAQAIEVFDEAGNSLGVLRPSAFTVN